MSDMRLYVQPKGNPAVRIMVALGAIAVIGAAVAGVYWYTAEPQAAKGAITKTFAVEQAGGRRIIVGVEVDLENLLSREIVVQEIEVKLTSGGTSYSDMAAPSFEQSRYLTALPALQQSAAPPLAAESRLPDHAKVTGLVIVGFPVSAQRFQERGSVEVTIRFFGHKPLTLRAK
ncbi:MAG: hypothetical protein HYX26_01810 [Acidobacteriales bacterium]|nr:hypothetical protein [Terriglobales bacterium]